MEHKTKILFVCLGNICRSPMAEGVMRHRVMELGLENRFEISSAGTGAWHVGKPPDPRAIATAQERGIDISAQRARQFKADDIAAFDYIFAMDTENLDVIENTALRAGPFDERASRAEISLLLDYSPAAPQGAQRAQKQQSRSVPDPYYGGTDGFGHVLNLIEQACRGFLEHLREQNS